jgi:uncharacterized membrane protein YvlD (DUF360 family)
MQRLNFNMRLFFKLIWRYSLVWIGDAVSIGVTALLVPGIYFLTDTRFWFLNPFVVALLFGLLNALVRPFLILLLLPITFVTLGLATLLLNGALFYLMHVIVPSFVIDSFGAAVVGVIVLTLVNTILSNLINVGDDYSFYATLMNKFGSLTGGKQTDAPARGLVVLQIDGLAHRTLKRALRKGKMPFLNDMLKRRRFVLKPWFCGLPSQTSAVQAGIFYGNSFDIPGFRWYDRKAGRLVVSSNSSDLSALDARMSDAHESILKNGTSILTLIHGGASKKLLTVSSLGDKDLKQHRGELEDFAIFYLHPYLYTRTMFFMVWDFLVDRVQALVDRIRRKGPKLVRSIRFSIHRAMGNTFFREITTFFIQEDIVRGMPVIYANYLGYDMVAHYSGPDSLDALSTLTGIDRHIKRMSRMIGKRAKGGSKTYDLIVLSDHGQTPCVSFKGLYGHSLRGLIAETLQRPFVEWSEENVELGYFDALLREMRIVEEAYGTSSIRSGRRTLERLQRQVRQVRDEPKHDEIVVCPSGNLAHVYFTQRPERVTTEYLLEEHPRLLETLAAHDGVGFVITTNNDGEYLMMGKEGMRRLRAGDVEGIDPLVPYADGDTIDVLAKTLADLAGYPNAGDLIVNGRLHKDGSVVSFEDQRGTHGGLGGEQTRAFVIYPRRLRQREEGVQNLEGIHAFLKALVDPVATPKG